MMSPSALYSVTLVPTQWNNEQEVWDSKKTIGQDLADPSTTLRRLFGLHSENRHQILPGSPITTPPDAKFFDLEKRLAKLC